MPLIKAFNDFLSEAELERVTKVISENAWIWRYKQYRNRK